MYDDGGQKISVSVRAVDGLMPEHILWERLQNDIYEKIFAHIGYEKYFTIKMHREVNETYSSYRDAMHDYTLTAYLMPVENRVVRIATIEDYTNSYVFKSALQECRDRLKRWAKKQWKNFKSEYMPWTK